MSLRSLAIPLVPALLAAAGMYRLLAGGPPLSVIDFYGRVVNEAGEPVEGAEVNVSIWSVDEWSSRSGPPLSKVTRHVTLTTDADGKFELDRERGYMLQILDVKKPSRMWVVDWGWTVTSTPDHLVDNRFYTYGGDDPIYLPDAARPAVFPLHHEGSPVLGQPSRGGADRYPDGRVVLNDPLTPVIPSAGPGAPRAGPEKERMLRELWRAASTRPSNS